MIMNSACLYANDLFKLQPNTTKSVSGTGALSRTADKP